MIFKKISKYLVLISICFIAIIILSLNSKDTNTIRIVNNVKEAILMKNKYEKKLIDITYYKDKMNISLVYAYPIDSSLNKIQGDSFSNEYNKKNTIMVFNISNPENLDNIIKSVKLKKGKYNIPTKYLGYRYNNGIILFLSTNTHINDFNNYTLLFTLDKNNKDYIFNKNYKIGSIKELPLKDYIRGGEITKLSDNNFLLCLTKKNEINGMKYKNRIEFDYKLAYINFGSNIDTDYKKYSILTKGKDKKYRPITLDTNKITITGDKQFEKSFKRKELNIKLTSYDTSKENTLKLQELLCNSMLQYNK